MPLKYLGTYPPLVCASLKTRRHRGERKGRAESKMKKKIGGRRAFRSLYWSTTLIKVCGSWRERRRRRRDRPSGSRIVVNSSQLLPVICDNIIISPLLGPKRCRPHAPGRIDDPWNRTPRRCALIGRPFRKRIFLRFLRVPGAVRRLESAFEIPIACPADRTLSHTRAHVRASVSPHNYSIGYVLLRYLRNSFVRRRKPVMFGHLNLQKIFVKFVPSLRSKS